MNIAQTRGYTLENVRELYKDDSSRLPSEEDMSILDVGEFAKLIFKFNNPENREFPGVTGERMWVEVIDRKGDVYIGKLENEPITTGGLLEGNLVDFKKENVLEVLDY